MNGMDAALSRGAASEREVIFPSFIKESARGVCLYGTVNTIVVECGSE